MTCRIAGILLLVDDPRRRVCLPIQIFVIFQDIRTWRSAWAAHAVPPAGELPFTVPCVEHTGFLAALAYHPVPVAPRLPVYPAWREPPGNRYLNPIITMALGGLWHGSNIRFLVWGSHAWGGLAVVHAFHELKKRFWPDGFTPSPALHWCGVGAAWLLTFHFVSFLWVFFRAEDMERSLEILRRVCLRAARRRFPVTGDPRGAHRSGAAAFRGEAVRGVRGCAGAPAGLCRRWSLRSWAVLS